MAVRMTTGMFPVETGTAALQVEARITVTNLESQPAPATVTVVKLADGRKETVRVGELNVPAHERQTLVVDGVAGETLEVTVDLPERDPMGGTGMRPAVAVVSVFTGDGSVTLLQYISAGDFVPVQEIRPAA